jgi:hypothetical protein
VTDFIHLHRCVETPWNREESYIRERLDGKPRHVDATFHPAAVFIGLALLVVAIVVTL